jgi:hypothetical protein
MIHEPERLPPQALEPRGVRGKIIPSYRPRVDWIWPRFNGLACDDIPIIHLRIRSLSKCCNLTSLVMFCIVPEIENSSLEKVHPPSWSMFHVVICPRVRVFDED